MPKQPQAAKYDGPESVVRAAIEEFNQVTLDDIDWPVGGKLAFWLSDLPTRKDREMIKDLLFAHFDSVVDGVEPIFPTSDIQMDVVGGLTLVTIIGDASRARKSGPRLVR